MSTTISGIVTASAVRMIRRLVTPNLVIGSRFISALIYLSIQVIRRFSLLLPTVPIQPHSVCLRSPAR